LNYSKATIHVFLNSFNNGFADIFFKNITHLGDGIFIPIFIIIMLFIRFRYAFFVIIVYTVSGLFTQLLKRTFFEDVVRPTKFLDAIAELHLVPGVEQLCCKSFPSGHSTTAFGIMICFAIVLQNRYLKLFSFILAALIAYSRVYLSQHFLLDIFVGSLIGAITGLISYKLIEPLKWQWLDKSLLSVLKTNLANAI
jgi:membrane-associated phospholipid phosphatase